MTTKKGIKSKQILDTISLNIVEYHYNIFEINDKQFSNHLKQFSHQLEVKLPN